MIGNIVLPIFFLYFVLISGYCSSLLNCGLQRFMKNSIYFKHFLILLSIYIFTFILNWYTFDSLQIAQQENFKNKINKFNKDSLIKLGKWFLYSVAIYSLFIVSTKSEVPYIILFFTVTIISILIQIILKSISSESYNNNANKLFITSKDYNGINKNTVIISHNFVSAIFITSLVLLFVGFYKYFRRQYKDHSHHWDTSKFIFGTSKCREE
jgi:hypothetical protein